MKALSIGFTACYIHDYRFNHVTDIPQEAAVEWVKAQFPETVMGLNTKAKDLVCNSDNIDLDPIMNGWLNKLFIIVGQDHGKWIALYNHDGVFSVRIKEGD